jgi:hypothetical protein
LKRTSRQFVATTSLLWRTAIAGTSLKLASLRRQRELSAALSLRLTRNNVGAAAFAPASLRIALRRLVKRQKAVSRLSAENKFRVNRRLDARGQYRRSNLSPSCPRVQAVAILQKPHLVPLLINAASQLPTPTEKLLVRPRYRN